MAENTTEAVFRFQELPRELVYHVASFMKLRELKSISSTSKEMRACFSGSLFHGVAIVGKPYMIVAQLRAFLPKKDTDMARLMISNAKHLHLRIFNDHQLKVDEVIGIFGLLAATLQELKNVSAIKFQVAEHLPQQMYPQLDKIISELPAFPRLSSLQFNEWRYFDRLAAKFPKDAIKSLIFDGHHHWSDLMKAARGQCPDLRRLILRSPFSWPNQWDSVEEAATTIAQDFPKMEWLSIDNGWGLDLEIVMGSRELKEMMTPVLSIASKMPELKRLSVRMSAGMACEMLASAEAAEGDCRTLFETKIASEIEGMAKIAPGLDEIALQGLCFDKSRGAWNPAFNRIIKKHRWMKSGRVYRGIRKGSNRMVVYCDNNPDLHTFPRGLMYAWKAT